MFIIFIIANKFVENNMKIRVVIILLFFVVNAFGQSKKILAPTPPMGWNSWNWFGKK